ncbi:MAG TPA: hypothetical protein VFO65_11720, partial [Acidimicrobiales bacterium]|nr:hypothetical protein [Acidimicrobiales bacterium]
APLLGRHRGTGDSIDPAAILASVGMVAAGTVAAVVPLVLAMRWAVSRARWGRPTLLLAARRLAADPLPAAAVVGVASVCVGLFAYGTLLQSSAKRTIDAKAGVFVGGEVSVVVPEIEAPPAPLAARSTAVRWVPDVGTDGPPVDVLGVDPATFEAGAFWDRRLADAPLAELLPALRGTARGGRVPALAVGDVADRVDLDLDQAGEVAVAVVARPRAFPGLRSRPLIVIDRRHLGGDDGERQLWSNLPVAEVAGAVRDAGLEARFAVTMDRVFDAPAFYTLDWSFGFLRGTAAWAATVASLGFLVHLDLRRRRALPAEVVLVTMGLRRRAQAASRVLELAVPLFAGCLLGTALALAGASGSHRTVDLVPYVPPAAILDVPAAQLATVVAVVLAALPLLAAAVHLRRPGPAGEVLRSELV